MPPTRSGKRGVAALPPLSRGKRAKSEEVKEEDEDSALGLAPVAKKIKVEEGQMEPASPASAQPPVELRRFYPEEMSDMRASAYADGALERPIKTLADALDETAAARAAAASAAAVVHWFRKDLRAYDNRSLWAASQKARDLGVPLLGLYVLSPQDLEAHLAAPKQVDLILRTLRVLRDSLDELDIPLHVETVPRRRDVPARVTALLDEWRARHVFANMEYEVDELRRDAALVRSLAGRDPVIGLDVLHDTCVVPPGALETQTGNQYAVFTPWYRSWSRHLGDHPELLRRSERPGKNPAGARHEFRAFFGQDIPPAPESKRLPCGEEEARRTRDLWPAGEAEAMRRLDSFCDDRIAQYKNQRDMPGRDGTSSISPYLAVGAISSRTCVGVATARRSAQGLGAAGGQDGIETWISEVAWRDFYRHVLVNWPYVCMHKPFKLAAGRIEWTYDQAHFQAWRDGRTGFPLVDAAMRQMAEIGWMHNRCRMVVASFLAKDLMLDWRQGERYFMETLIDGDFASNSGGWGFGASVGVDPQPYFRIFNPFSQSEKFDPQGEYIRRWVPELRAVDGDAVHAPYARGAATASAAAARKAGYPEPIVNHKTARERALAEYKRAFSKRE